MYEFTNKVKYRLYFVASIWFSVYTMGEDLREAVVELEERISELEHQVEKLSNVVKWLTSAVVVVPQELIEINNRCSSVSDELARIAVEYQCVPQHISEKYKRLPLYWIEIGLTRLREDIESKYSILMKVIESIEEFDNLVAEVLNNMIDGFIGANLVAVIEVVLAISAKLNIEFNELASIFINSLGKELIKKGIELNAITRYYGEEAPQKWKKIIED